MSEPIIRRGSRVVVARQYGPGMPECCVSGDLLRSLAGDTINAGTVVSVETVSTSMLDGRECVWSEVAVACVIPDCNTEDQYQLVSNGMPRLTAWRIPVACLQEVPDERVMALEAEVARLRAVIAAERGIAASEGWQPNGEGWSNFAGNSRHAWPAGRSRNGWAQWNWLVEGGANGVSPTALEAMEAADAAARKEREP